MLNACRLPNSKTGGAILHVDDARQIIGFVDTAELWIWPPGNLNKRVRSKASIDRQGLLETSGVIALDHGTWEGLGLAETTPAVPVEVRCAKPRQPSIAGVFRLSRPLVVSTDEIDFTQRLRTGAERLVVLFDSSGSMAGQKIEEAKRALRTLLFEKLLRPVPDAKGLLDEVGLIRFGGHAEVVFAPTPDFLDQLEAIFALRAGGCTPLQDALELTWQQFGAWTGPERRAIVISDGGARVSSGCVKRLVENRVCVTAVSIGGPGNATLRAITQATGGIVVEVQSIDLLDTVFGWLA